MKSYLGLWFGVLLFIPTSRAANAYVDAGAPPPDRAWAGRDYRTFATLLQSKAIPLPTLTNPDGRVMLQRLWHPENFAFARNRDVQVGDRLNEAVMLNSSLKHFMLAYADEAARGRKVGRELVETMAFILRTGVVIIEVLDELVPQIPPANRAEAEGELTQMKSGIAGVFDEVETSLANRAIYSASDLSLLLAAMAETLPRLQSALSPDAKANLHRRLRSRQAGFRAKPDVEQLEKMIALLAPQRR